MADLSPADIHEVARANAEQAGARNTEFLKGYIEEIPLADAEFRSALAEAGLTDVEIRETHRVHEHAGSAVVRARKPR